jgi:alkanesulfonate monooxygenase SsuD/methylene tetrahydromethanopterin reductase-like flavin-dependent oxidoreductase (luciferase family)
VARDLERLRAAGALRLGLCLPSFSSPGPRLFRTPNVEVVDASDLVRVAQEAESLGFDSIWSADHLMLGKDNEVLEGWTLLSAVAGATRSAELGLIHEGNLQRLPAVHAKMIGTLDQISGGRFVFFFDSGTRASEYLAYGLDWNDDAAVRLAQLTEALSLIKLLWTTTGPVDFEGRFYRVDKAEAAPRPVQVPHPPIWFGEASPGILELCAREGDGWNSTPVASAELRRRLDLLDRACRAAGRPPAELEKSFETQILVAEDLAVLREMLDHLVSKPDPSPPDGRPQASRAGYGVAEGVAEFIEGKTDELPPVIADTWIIGTPEQARVRLRQLRDLGVDHLLLWFMDLPDRTGMRLFIEEVAPEFR